MRLLYTPSAASDERLLWSRDIRFAKRLASMVAGSRVVELDSGIVAHRPGRPS